MNYRSLFLIYISLLLTACAGTQPIDFPASKIITDKDYASKRNSHGVVLMDVNWGRYWGCGSYDNAQLISLTFDRQPISDNGNELEPTLVIHSPSRLFVDPVFLNQGFMLEPGEYALSGFSIKVANSQNSVSFKTARRDNLYSQSKPIGGTFSVAAGEVVYIGNFGLDCAYGPTLWRYHSQDRQAFTAHVGEYKSSFPFLADSKVIFRLFSTKKFGYDFELPE